MAKLTQNSYGKSNVRLTKVTRNPDGRHDLKEISVNIQLTGDFEPCYTTGDNSMVIPTDTMKNTVYALGRNHPIHAIEEFASALGRQFIEHFPQVSSAGIEIFQTPWTRINVGGSEHPHAFFGGSSERRACSVRVQRDETSIESGLSGLLLLKTAGSGFVDFVKDRFTTLKDTTERIFATSLSVAWNYRSYQPGDGDRNFDLVRQTLLTVFATHDSLGVQHTLYAMGEEVLARCDQIQQISLKMPNQHRLLVNLEPFGLDNPQEIFVPTDEPFGMISGTVSRS